MLSNFGKCKSLHTGNGNLDVKYKVGNIVLGPTVKEKELGVSISAEIKSSEQCGIVASQCNKNFGWIGKNITYKEKSLFISL